MENKEEKINGILDAELLDEETLGRIAGGLTAPITACLRIADGISACSNPFNGIPAGDGGKILFSAGDAEVK